VDDPQGSNANCGDKTVVGALVRLEPVRATNYGRWCQWWLQSDPV